jgi:hypothetical protein
VEEERKNMFQEIVKGEFWLYISLIEQIQFSFVISKSYTQLPAEEHFYARKAKKITKRLVMGCCYLGILPPNQLSAISIQRFHLNK